MAEVSGCGKQSGKVEVQQGSFHRAGGLMLRAASEANSDGTISKLTKKQTNLILIIASDGD